MFIIRIVAGGSSKKKNNDFHAVKNLSFDLVRGETLGIVGESGSGKSSIAQALIKLVSSSGNIFFKKKKSFKST